ncbi:hypothetical protein BV22DRAFT_1135977, partial [Leucogyrophana mollusca]
MAFPARLEKVGSVFWVVMDSQSPSIVLPKDALALWPRDSSSSSTPPSIDTIFQPEWYSKTYHWRPFVPVSMGKPRWFLDLTDELPLVRSRDGKSTLRQDIVNSFQDDCVALTQLYRHVVQRDFQSGRVPKPPVINCNRVLDSFEDPILCHSMVRSLKGE